MSSSSRIHSSTSTTPPLLMLSSCIERKDCTVYTSFTFIIFPYLAELSQCQRPVSPEPRLYLPLSKHLPHLPRVADPLQRREALKERPEPVRSHEASPREYHLPQTGEDSRRSLAPARQVLQHQVVELLVALQVEHGQVRAALGQADHQLGCRPAEAALGGVVTVGRAARRVFVVVVGVLGHWWTAGHKEARPD